ncbi:hypothetical protein [Actinopolymorpha pittospori]|uniref:ATP-dependent Clp protease ATP-binding subunit ClpA n=1 Tax=Actinopolymorpha pittospori TaxID=648752 RepID=A0A927RHC7_9ACTN|nr:hypothetical protein [Actinopolymorpha pittospori]MBE1612075.1 ATP-dependent Clp protease ATP-binding subunit ClpA [Actinopolymorpha pittospori]
MDPDLAEELSRCAAHHGVTFDPRAVTAALHLARRLEAPDEAPAVAFDWLDQAAINVRSLALVQAAPRPNGVDEVDVARVASHRLGLPLSALIPG